MKVYYRFICKSFL